MALIVPLRPVPNQTLNVGLGGQNCKLNIFQKGRAVFMDVYVNNALIVAGALCLDRNRIVRSAYLGFVSDLIFVDTQGTSDPDYAGLGSRFQLLYLEATDT